MKKFLRSLPYIVILLAAAAVLLCCRLIVTAGASMEPTYHTGDKLICVRAFSEPEAGDVILFEKDGKMLIKRVAGVCGDTVDLADDQLPAYDYWGSATVPSGYVFVTGDNPQASYDSRDPDFGLIPISDIWGYVLFKI